MDLFALMRMFTIRVRMLGAIAVVLVLLGLLGGAGMFGMFRIYELNQSFLNGPFQQAGLVAKLQRSLTQVRNLEKEMIIQYEQPEQLKKTHADWSASLQTVQAAGAALTQVAPAQDGAVVQQLLKHLEQYQTLFAPVARQLLDNGYDSATVAQRVGRRAGAEFVEAEKQLQTLEQLLQAQAQAAEARGSQVASQTQWLFVLALVITTLVVAPLTLLNMVSICRPLTDAKRLADAIAKGNLTEQLDVVGKDEVSDLQNALKAMQDNLNRMVGRVRDASGNIATASQEIAMGNGDLSARTEQTASNLQETVASLMQLTATVQQTASSAQMANQLAASASQTAAQGGSVVSQAVESMHEISSSSRKIGDIIGLIDSIAFQTNILALNAAVEAARAGEQGRGFAVVAGEVRLLARRSAEAASDIKRLIQSSVNAVDGGVRHVESAGKTMQEIMGSIQRVGDIIGEITAAANEQSTGISQVNQAVGDIDQMTQQNAALVEQSTAAAESLKEQTHQLSDVVSQFILSNQPAALSAATRPHSLPRAGGAMPVASTPQRAEVPLLG
ncbi:methyl-accepting chemotaxis protein [Comamonas aquatica]|uniref:methyl-accepting chemotaxis protein n=1 Tax=Comamonas aquatica TaxID=225991 RepID=UPI00244A0B15|nr:methyl-accepting chemotaxis protein [Comamonas aquatica]MDH0382012.1 methyl-accepting chemotaxis protein [Comamonas aquatica]MDH0430208.1 methyl-accepting chemotaxis protein [Comamonas aquatica]MDH0900013.1 methyl-accepting chemotaxis protein [Comamonas aquatica]MDH0941105.1 methyl-accepting chemotaxis protein [Comamonas aquatica]